MKHDKNSDSFETGFAYVRGRIEAQAEFAQALSVLSGELAARMGSIFSEASPLRALLGVPDSVRNVRDSPAVAHKGKRRALALDDGSRTDSARPREPNLDSGLNSSGNRRGMSQKPKPAIPKSHRTGIKDYWDRMTVDQRKKEMQRRLALAQQRRNAAELAEKRARNAEKKRIERARKAGEQQESAA